MLTENEKSRILYLRDSGWNCDEIAYDTFQRRYFSEKIQKCISKQITEFLSEKK